MEQSNCVQKIIFNPVSWMDDSYFRLNKNSNSILEKAAINEILISSLELTTDSDMKLNTFNEEIVRNWNLLSKAAFLMACLRYRAQLSLQGTIGCLDNSIQNFLKLKFFCQLSDKTADFSQQLNMQDLYRKAYLELVAFFPFFSDLIKERIIYLFPKSINFPLKGKSEDLPIANFLLIRTALQHVKYYS